MCFAGIFAAEEYDANNGIAVIIGHGEALPEEIIVRLYKFEDGVANLVAETYGGDGIRVRSDTCVSPVRIIWISIASKIKTY